MAEKCTKKTSIGGQALIEGIMMRGPKKTAMAVRDPKGEIVLKKWDTKNPNSILHKIPFVRGIFNMISSLATGYKCLSESAEISMDLEELERQEAATKALKKRAKAEGRPYKELLAEENARKQAEANSRSEAVQNEASEEPTDFPAENKVKEEKEKIKEPGKSSGSQMGIIMVISVCVALVLVVGLFVFLPEFIYNLIFGELSVRATAWDYFGRSAFTGIIKLALLVLYMWGVSFMKDIKRTFMYHGAEHKTIFCYEKGLELTVENVRMQKRFHPRCGTSFITLVVLVGIVLGGLIQIDNIFLRTFVRVLLVPVIVGIGYELIKFAGRHDNIVTRIISAPGVWLQHITTKEPTDDMIECAIKSINEVIPEDKTSDNW